MKFTVNSTELQRALAKVGGVIPSRSTMPILEHMLFDLVNDTLTITATDMEISLVVSLKVQGSEDGRVAIPAKRITETIRSLPDSSPSFHVDTTTNKIKIHTDTGEYVLTGESAKEYPGIPQFKGTKEISMESEALKRLIQRTSFAVSNDELRPAMMGVFLQSKQGALRAVATDGHRLVKYSRKMGKAIQLDKDVIIPAKALGLVARSLEAGQNTIGINDTHVKFMFDSTVLISRLIDETYPNYESVIPSDNDKELTVKREDAIASIRRVALYASATTHQVRFSIRKDSLTVTAQDIDFGGEAREKVPCSYTGEDLDIGFNANYVLDILTHLDAEEVTFRFSSATRAGIVTPATPKEDEDVIMLVMPVRLTS